MSSPTHFVQATGCFLSLENTCDDLGGNTPPFSQCLGLRTSPPSRVMQASALTESILHAGVGAIFSTVVGRHDAQYRSAWDELHRYKV